MNLYIFLQIIFFLGYKLNINYLKLQNMLSMLHGKEYRYFRLWSMHLGMWLCKLLCIRKQVMYMMNISFQKVQNMLSMIHHIKGKFHQQIYNIHQGKLVYILLRIKLLGMYMNHNQCEIHHGKFCN